MASEVYAAALKRKILSHNFDQRFYINREKQEVLERLKRYKAIIIKEADIGSAKVVLAEEAM